MSTVNWIRLPDHWIIELLPKSWKNITNAKVNNDNAFWQSHQLLKPFSAQKFRINPAVSKNGCRQPHWLILVITSTRGTRWCGSEFVCWKRLSCSLSIYILKTICLNVYTCLYKEDTRNSKQSRSATAASSHFAPHCTASTPTAWADLHKIYHDPTGCETLDRCEALCCFQNKSRVPETHQFPTNSRLACLSTYDMSKKKPALNYAFDGVQIYF